MLALLLLPLALAVGLLGYLAFRMIFVEAARAQGRPLPGPPDHPFFGHIGLVGKTIGMGLHLDILLTELSKLYGKVFRVNFVFFEMCVVTDVELAREVGRGVDHPSIYPGVG